MMDLAEKIAAALGVTGLVLLVATVAVGMWVSSGGWERKKFQSVVVALGSLSGALFIAAGWVGILG